MFSVIEDASEYPGDKGDDRLSFDGSFAGAPDGEYEEVELCLATAVSEFLERQMGSLYAYTCAAKPREAYSKSSERFVALPAVNTFYFYLSVTLTRKVHGKTLAVWLNGRANELEEVIKQAYNDYALSADFAPLSADLIS